jgi:hypothetical protein
MKADVSAKDVTRYFGNKSQLLHYHMRDHEDRAADYTLLRVHVLSAGPKSSSVSETDCVAILSSAGGRHGLGGKTLPN